MVQCYNERKRMRVLHLVPGLSSPANGIAVAARLIASAQGADLADCRDAKDCNLSAYGEVWVHSMWTPQVWRACRAVLKAGKPLVRMTHGCLDPVRVRFRGWKKALVAPVERALFRRTARVAVTGEWERAWCLQWGVKGPFEVVDLKLFFKLPVGDGGATGRRALPEDAARAPEAGAQPKVADRPLHLLYLGRRHPLKGLDVLEAAVASLRTGDRCAPGHSGAVELRVVSNAFGEEKERVWDWCDVLVLPTLSENFGLVVAEALARGKRVVTTDGAPAWEGQAGVVYLKGYRDGTSARRVELLADALARLANP